jgi:xanthine dehydrogenase small subunit
VTTPLTFALNGVKKQLVPHALHQSLLDYIRLEARLTATKEGCNEGDCGACTVIIEKNGEFNAVNACIKLLITCDGANIFTLEYLKMHKLQQAFIDHNAAQCGFCTPGFIMSLYALGLNETAPSLTRIESAIAGNLCRCTGYQPIIKAAMEAYKTPFEKPFCHEFTPQSLAFEGYFAPLTLEELSDYYKKHPDSLLLAGLTDIGLWINKSLMRPPRMIDLSKITALQNIVETPDAYEIGAMVTLSRVKALFETLHPELFELMRRFGGEQVRNAGTIGGNIGNGSPIGDLPPVLIALNATLVLNTREMSLESFFLAYKSQDIHPGEFIVKVILPKLSPSLHLSISKISKRFDEDISTLLGVFAFEIDNNHIQSARIAFGGMAGIPKRANHLENALIGRIWSETTLLNAQNMLDLDFTSLSDMRASSHYRQTVAKNLLLRAFHGERL